MYYCSTYLSAGRLKRDRTPLGCSSITKLRGKRHWHVSITFIDCGYQLLNMGGVGGAFNEQLLRGSLPSIFELFAQEAMATALQPAIEYVIKVNSSRDLYIIIQFTVQVLSHNFPAVLGRLWTGKDEIFLLMNCILEGYSIGNHGEYWIM